MPRLDRSRSLHPSNRASCSGREGAAVVVRMRGDYDIATLPALTRVLESALEFGDDDLVIDLSEVTFMDVATALLLTKTGVRLAARRRELTMQRPSSPSRLVLDLCSAGGLIGLATVEMVEEPAAEVAPERVLAERNPHRSNGHVGVAWSRACP